MTVSLALFLLAGAERAHEKRERRIRYLEDKLADKEERLSKWGFGMQPSERRRMQEDIDALQEELDSMTA